MGQHFCFVRSTFWFESQICQKFGFKGQNFDFKVKIGYKLVF